VVAKAREVAEEEVEVSAATQQGESFKLEATIHGDIYRVDVQGDGVVHFEKQPPARGLKRLFRRRG